MGQAGGAKPDGGSAAETFEERELVDARIAALMEDHPELVPPTPPELISGPRHAWGCWSGGYLSTLEVLIDRSSPELHPDVRSGFSGWVRALRELLSHPACALLEQLLLRFDLRGEPLDETTFASQLARSVLADDPSGASPRLGSVDDDRRRHADTRQRHLFPGAADHASDARSGGLPAAGRVPRLQ